MNLYKVRIKKIHQLGINKLTINCNLTLKIEGTTKYSYRYTEDIALALAKGLGSFGSENLRLGEKERG